MITIVHVGLFILFIGASVILTVFFYWLKDRKARKKQKEIIKNLDTMSKLERDAYLKNGGDINISDKEVKENERQSELRRRKLAELRELEATSRGITKPAYNFENRERTGEGFYLPSSDSEYIRKEPQESGNQFKESGRDPKKIRFSKSEDF